MTSSRNVMQGLGVVAALAAGCGPGAAPRAAGDRATAQYAMDLCAGVVCDDGDPCTFDECDEGRCLALPLRDPGTCTPQDACHTAAWSCDPAGGPTCARTNVCGSQWCSPGFWKNYDQALWPIAATTAYADIASMAGDTSFASQPALACAYTALADVLAHPEECGGPATNYVADVLSHLTPGVDFRGSETDGTGASYACPLTMTGR